MIVMSAFKIYLQDGTLTDLSNYQSKEGLDKEQIGEHFSLDEAVFQSNMADYTTVYWCEPIIKLLDAFRSSKGEPVTLTSVYRSSEKQQELIDRGLTDATVSPHNLSFAADIDCKDDEDVIRTANLIRTIGKNHNIPTRVGYQSYLQRGDTFVHVDVCNYYYGEGGPFADHTHLLRSYSNVAVPDAFRQKVTW